MLTANDIAKLIFAFVVLVYWTASFFILYHLIRFGVSGQPKRIAVIFLAGSLVLTMVAVLLFSQVDFGQILSTSNISLFNFNQ
jgi:hypothetical protein